MVNTGTILAYRHSRLSPDAEVDKIDLVDTETAEFQSTDSIKSKSRKTKFV